MPPARRPAPRPPAAARPARLSVSDVDRLVRDPYAVYARKVLRPPPARPAGPQGRRADPRQRDPRRARRLRRAHPRRPRPRRRGDVPRRGPRGLRRRGALAGGQRALDRAADARRALVPRRRGRAPRRRHARRPRGQGQPPARRHRRHASPPAPTASTAPPAATRSTTTSPARPRAAPRPLRATCSCRSRRRSPRRAASRGWRPGRSTRLEVIRFGGSEPEVIPLDPAGGRRDLGAARRRWSATTSTRAPASSPACGRASTRATTTTCRGSANGPTATSPTRSPGHDRRDRRRRCAPRAPTPRAGSPPTPARARPGC